MILTDNTSLDVLLIRRSYGLRYRIERCGESEWMATVEDMTNQRNLDAVRLPTIDAARMTHAAYSRAIATAVESGRWRAVRRDAAAAAQPDWPEGWTHSDARPSNPVGD